MRNEQSDQTVVHIKYPTRKLINSYRRLFRACSKVSAGSLHNHRVYLKTSQHAPRERYLQYQEDWFSVLVSLGLEKCKENLKE